MTNEPSPRPWRVEANAFGIYIVGADDRKAAQALTSKANASLIVAAVNKHGRPITELVKGYGELEVERDRLRDIVRRLVNQFGNLTSYEDDAAILREARAAIGEGENLYGKGVGR